MYPTPELIDSLYWDKVKQARATPPDEKLLDGPRLFDFVCRVMKDGIRSQFPDATEQEVDRILVRRLEIVRDLEDEV